MSLNSAGTSLFESEMEINFKAVISVCWYVENYNFLYEIFFVNVDGFFYGKTKDL